MGWKEDEEGDGMSKRGAKEKTKRQEGVTRMMKGRRRRV